MGSLLLETEDLSFCLSTWITRYGKLYFSSVVKNFLRDTVLPYFEADLNLGSGLDFIELFTES